MAKKKQPKEKPQPVGRDWRALIADSFLHPRLPSPVPDSRTVNVLLACCAALVIVVYLSIDWLASGSGDWWAIDWVDHFTIFSGDDAYRFFLARSAWSNPQVYLFNFDLPVDLVLNGIIAAATGGDIFLSRIGHALMAIAGLWFVYRTLRLLDTPAWIAIPSVLLLAAMPLYAMVSLSFYGEAWLTFGVCLCLYAMTAQRIWLLTVLGSLLPLIRPEGIFFTAGIGFYLLLLRDFRRVVALGMPGGVYFLAILLSPGGLEAYQHWRFALIDILNRTGGNPEPMAMLYTLNMVWYCLALMALFFPRSRALWPLWLGALLWTGFLLLTLVTGNSFYEPRYLLSLTPVFCVGWALFFAQIADWWRNGVARAMCIALFGGLTLYVATDHVLQVDPLAKVNAWRQIHGEWPDFEGRDPWRLLFFRFTSDEIRQRKEAAQLIEQIVSADPRIDTLVQGDVYLFYFLDPDKLPARVTVAYPAVYWPFLKRMLDGQLMAIHPGEGRHYDYYAITRPDLSTDKPRLIYVEQMHERDYPYRWQVGAHEIYLFDYRKSGESPVDLKNAPVIDPATIPQDELIRPG